MISEVTDFNYDIHDIIYNFEYDIDFDIIDLWYHNLQYHHHMKS
jgi:hypothetical protein